tara:strand:+ start:452 stop:676 length:225 start_codon:yes stop_codon:yes gene_type:complete
MYYSFILFYLLLSFLYFINIKIFASILEKIYQNASSKNRKNIKETKVLIESRKKIYIILTWPLYEIYLLINKNE